MEVWIYNKELKKIRLIDKIKSFTDTVYYNSAGSFSLECPVEFFDSVKCGNYVVQTNDRKHSFVIEYVEKDTDEEGADYLIVKGRTLESIFDRRVSVTPQYFEEIEPYRICHTLLNNNVINPADATRKIDNVVTGETALSDDGGASYQVNYSNVLNDISNLLTTAYLGWNCHINDERKIQFDIYKGVNRTERANTDIQITVNSIAPVNQGDRLGNFDGWNQYNPYSDYFERYSLNFESGILTKRKWRDREKIWSEDGQSFRWGEFFWLQSGHLEQNVSVNPEHLYYIQVMALNNTSTQLNCGIKTINENGEASYNIQVEANTPWTLYTRIFKPETSSVVFSVGVGDLEESESVFAQFDYATIIDLTATFGVGNEPTLEECEASIYYENGWKYKTKVVTLIPNYTPLMAFSRDRDTLLTVEYSHNTTQEKTRLYTKGSDGTIITIDEGASGIDLKESFLDANTSTSISGATIPTASYRAMIRKQGEAELKKLTDAESIGGTFYMLSNKKLGRDFYLGDMVDFVDNRLGIVTYKRISSITETWSGDAGYTLDITLGDDIMDVQNYIKLVSKGVR